MNWYFESFIDKLEKAQSKEQAKQLMDLCCEGKNPQGQRVARGCIHCVHCDETRCPVYRQYQTKLILLDTSTIVKSKSVGVHNTRKYKIKPKVQCKRTVTAYITRMSKKAGVEDQAVMISIQEHINGERFKRALNLAKKHNFNTIVETINDYISASAAK